MTNESTSRKETNVKKARQNKTSIKRVLDAYRMKKLTDQNFRATVLALKVCGFVLLLIVLIVLLIQSSAPGLPSNRQTTVPGFDEPLKSSAVR